MTKLYVKADNRIIRNNVDNPIIVSHDKYYLIDANDRNMQRVDMIEAHAIPFSIEIEGDDDDFGSSVKAVLRVDDRNGNMNNDLSVVCHLQRIEHNRYNELRDYNVHLFRQSVQEAINKLSCQYVGVNIVAEWADGSSDATDLPLYTATDFRRDFPEADIQQVLDFYRGKGDGFVVREWTDDDGTKVTDKVYYCCDTQAFKEKGEKVGVNDKIEVYLDDCERFLEIHMNIRHFDTLRSK